MEIDSVYIEQRDMSNGHKDFNECLQVLGLQRDEKLNLKIK